MRGEKNTVNMKQVDNPEIHFGLFVSNSTPSPNLHKSSKKINFESGILAFFSSLTCLLRVKVVSEQGKGPQERQEVKK